MEKINFNGKRIIIRKLSHNDLKTKKLRKFQDFINSLVGEQAKIVLNKKMSLPEERKFLEEKLKNIGKRREVFLAAEAEDSNMIVGTSGIALDRWRKEHIGNFGITIRKSYRGIGLGKYLMEEILKLAKKELKPRPKIIRLSVYPNNKPAVALYRKFGFRKVAEIPKQIQYRGKFLNEVIMLLEL